MSQSNHPIHRKVTGSKSSSAADDTTGNAGPRLQMKRALQGLGYAEQKEALKPPAPIQLQMASTSSLQCRSTGSEKPLDVHKTAKEGLSGSGGALPHLDQIQMAFGQHDVSDVSAHVGGVAKDASTKLGASAYTSGNQVAFKESPDLHTSAHEAAHVVQQRAGVQLEGGVGKPGDVHEKHADAVADSVVSGKSAEGLLNSNSNSGPGVQHKPADGFRVVQREDTDEQVSTNWNPYHKRALKIASTAKMSFLRLYDFHNVEVGFLGSIKPDSATLVDRYDAAYKKHEAKINEADEAERSRQATLDLILGFVCSAAAGFGGVGLASMSAAFAAASNVTTQLVGATASTALSAAVGDVKAKLTNPGALAAIKKANKSAERWKMIAELYENMADFMPTLGELAKLALKGTEVAYDCNTMQLGGEKLEYHDNQTHLEKDGIALMALNLGPAIQKIEDQICTDWSDLRVLANALTESVKTVDELRIQKDIWVTWIAHLPNSNDCGCKKHEKYNRANPEYDQIDINEIEEHLKSINVIGGRHSLLRKGSDDDVDTDDERAIKKSAVERFNALQNVGRIGTIVGCSYDGLKMFKPEKGSGKLPGLLYVRRAGGIPPEWEGKKLIIGPPIYRKSGWEITVELLDDYFERYGKNYGKKKPVVIKPSAF